MVLASARPKPQSPAFPVGLVLIGSSSVTLPLSSFGAVVWLVLVVPDWAVVPVSKTAVIGGVVFGPTDASPCVMLFTWITCIHAHTQTQVTFREWLVCLAQRSVHCVCCLVLGLLTLVFVLCVFVWTFLVAVSLHHYV